MTASDTAPTGTAPIEPLYRRVLAGSANLTFGLVGERLGHSHSPRIHELLGSVPYERVEVPRDEVRAFFAARRYRGLNVTIPYKCDAARAADVRSEAVERLGNANTLVVREDGTLFADNTDYHGFSRQLDLIHANVAGQACLVLGDGGAAATVRAVLADRGASLVVSASRKGELTFAALAGDAAAASPSQIAQADTLRAEVVLIVNATPVGMYPHADDDMLVDLDRFPALRYVCDLVYNPLRTRLIQEGRARGLACAGGLSMLVAQAKRSSDLFLGVDRPDDIEEGVLAQMRAELAVVSLIGMPGSGKTRTGMLLAEMLGFEFVDTDEMVQVEAGMPIPQIFEELGEEGFRAIETRCVAQATSCPGRVVATGGGVVTRPENRFFLEQNGPVVLLTRGLVDDPSDNLAVEGRPLSQAKGLERLRAERADLYHAWADIEVAPSGGSPLGTARRICRLVKRI